MSNESSKNLSFSLIGNIKTFLIGIILGIANIIPGVSAGTMALITGIYEKLINSIDKLTKRKSNKISEFIFLGIIVLGVATGIFSLSKFMEWLMEGSFTRQITYLSIIGLIIGSMPLVFKLHKDMKPNISRVLIIIIAIALAVILAQLGGNKNAAPEESIEEIFGIIGYNGFDIQYCLWMILCGFLTTGTMILPGISGSALLVSLGEYENLLNIVSNRLVIQGSFFGIGAVLGIIIFSKLISYFIKNFPSLTYYFVIGLMLSSIYQAFKEMNFHIDLSPISLIVSTIALIGGFSLSFALSKLELDNKSNEQIPETLSQG